MSHPATQPSTPRGRPQANDAIHSLTLDEDAIEAARQGIDEGAVTPSYGPWRDEIVRLLNGALATELVCVLRYKRHHFTAHGLASPKIAEEFMVHANEEAAHADQIAERPAVQRGRMVNRVMGEPSSQLHERHDASDFDTKTQDKLNPTS